MREDLRNFRFKRIRSRGARREMKKTKDMTLVLIEFKLDHIRIKKKKGEEHNRQKILLLHSKSSWRVSY